MSGSPLPEIAASTVHLPPGPWTLVLDALCARFPRIARASWIDRMARGRVLDRHGEPLHADSLFERGMRVHYYREVATETPIDGIEQVLHVDDDLVVADKPPFLPVIPAGGFVTQTLLARLIARLGNDQLVPLHRIDRLTAGLVLFSANPATRGAYQALFREQRIEKIYQALAAPLPPLDFPLRRASRIVAGTPFFRMCESAGAPNSESVIEVLERGARVWRYQLRPVSGKKHQLRVHMAALGAPILNDPLYPQLISTSDAQPAPDDPARPLQLLAQGLRFCDPLHGGERRFESRQRLSALYDIAGLDGGA
jgi:tRNA pseudouridine32 synthase/23S rRNA pseudouridine746 synthase